MILTTRSLDGRVNLMPITFKSVGNILGDICINIFVSNQRYTCEILENGIQEFTLSRGPALLPWIEKTGVCSGRNVDKAKVHEVPLMDGRLTQIPVLAPARMSYECAIVGSVEKSEFLGFKMFLGSVLGVFHHSHQERELTFTQASQE